jgi:hypothetical protein
MARREGDGLNKPARQPKNDPLVPKSRSSLVWPEGRARPLPTEDRDLVRRLSRSPQDFDGIIDWIRDRLELDPPEFLIPGEDSELDLTSGQYDFDVTAQTLFPVYDEVGLPAGLGEVYLAGYSLEVRAVYTVIPSNADNANIQLRSGATEATATAAWNVIISPDSGSGTYDTGWQRMTPAGYTPTSPGLQHWLYAGGDPYSDTFPVQFAGTLYYRWIYDPDATGEYAVNMLPNGSSDGTDAVTYWDGNADEGAGGSWVAAATLPQALVTNLVADLSTLTTAAATAQATGDTARRLSFFMG